MPSSRARERAVRVVIADDQRMFAELLMAVLSEDERVDVVGIADDGAEAVRLAVELKPDVILMDLNMPVMNGLAATRQIRDAGLAIPVVLLTATDSDMRAEDAIAAGATAFLRKERGVEELRQVFVEVASLTAALGAVSS
jgi:DNA-binding NarL/FixJ family response regulator